MVNLTAKVRLRPTRIGFLVKPTDLSSVRKIMRTNTCLWGGMYNPIIPVARTLPAQWRGPFTETGISVAKGYIRFFEPDVYVEASEGLLEQAGVKRHRGGSNPTVVSLDDFLTSREDFEWNEPRFGLSVTDAVRDQFEKQEQFVLKKPALAIQALPNRKDGAGEAIFGVYPEDASNAYFGSNFKEVFSPEEVPASPDAWLRTFRDGALTPLFQTAHHIEKRRYWYQQDPTIFIFDPCKAIDLIDLWNMRIESDPILPIPYEWFGELTDFVSDLLRNHHRPLRGNKHGVMRNATLEFARSLSQDQRTRTLAMLVGDFQAGAVSVKAWRSRVWQAQGATRRISSPPKSF